MNISRRNRELHIKAPSCVDCVSDRWLALQPLVADLIARTWLQPDVNQRLDRPTDRFGRNSGEEALDHTAASQAFQPL